MTMRHKRYNLPKMIVCDLVHYNKIKLLMCIFILITSLETILVRHNTRLLLSKEEKLRLIHNVTRTEYKKLILEKKSLKKYKKIEKTAIIKLKMQTITSFQEKTVII
jgi:cell division protein FtsL